MPLSATDVRIDRLDFDPTRGSEAFEDSVARYGVLQPVVVTPTTAIGRFRVVAGRRRVTAASRAGFETVPCVLRSFAGEASLSAVAVQENRNRQINPLSDLEAVERLLEEGLTPENIAPALGLTVREVRAILRLRRLTPRMREAFRDGRVSPSSLDEIARLSADAQLRLLMGSHGGRITNAMVRATRVGSALQVEDVLVAEPAATVTRRSPDTARIARTDAGDYTLELLVTTPNGLRETISRTHVANVEFPAMAPVIPATVTITDLAGMETWAALAVLLDAAATCLPVEATDENEVFVAALADLQYRARAASSRIRP